MRRSVELSLVALAAMLGIVLVSGGAPSGMSALSVLEARNVIGGGPMLDSGCEGSLLTAEDPPGTGCDSTCLRIPNVFSKGGSGEQIPALSDCPNRCGRFAMATAKCGS